MFDLEAARAELRAAAGDLGGDRPGIRARRRDADRAEHADRFVHLVGDEVSRRHHAAVRGRRDQAHFRHGLLGDVAEMHQTPGRESHCLDARFQLGVGLELGRRLAAGLAEIRRAHHDDRHPVVDQRRFDTFDDVARVAGRQQRAARAAARDVEEVDHDRRGGPRHAVDAGGAVVAHAAARRLHGRDRDARGVDHVDAHLRHAVGGRHQPLLDRERPDPRQHVTAVLRSVDARLVGNDLKEEVVDVRVRAARRRDDRDLAGQRIGAADPVDLACVRRTHDGEQHPVAQRRVGREVGGQEERTLRRAAAHQRARDRGLRHERGASARARASS